MHCSIVIAFSRSTFLRFGHVHLLLPQQGPQRGRSFAGYANGLYLFHPICAHRRIWNNAQSGRNEGTSGDDSVTGHKGLCMKHAKHSTLALFWPALSSHNRNILMETLKLRHYWSQELPGGLVTLYNKKTNGIACGRVHWCQTAETRR